MYLNIQSNCIFMGIGMKDLVMKGNMLSALTPQGGIGGRGNKVGSMKQDPASIFYCEFTFTTVFYL